MIHCSSHINTNYPWKIQETLWNSSWKTSQAKEKERDYANLGRWSLGPIFSPVDCTTLSPQTLKTFFSHSQKKWRTPSSKVLKKVQKSSSSSERVGVLRNFPSSSLKLPRCSSTKSVLKIIDAYMRWDSFLGGKALFPFINPLYPLELVGLSTKVYY